MSPFLSAPSLPLSLLIRKWAETSPGSPHCLKRQSRLSSPSLASRSSLDEDTTVTYKGLTSCFCFVFSQAFHSHSVVFRIPNTLSFIDSCYTL